MTGILRTGTGNQYANKAVSQKLIAALNPEAKIDGSRVLVGDEVWNVTGATDPKIAMLQPALKARQHRVNLPEFYKSEGFDVLVIVRQMRGRVSVYELRDFHALDALLEKRQVSAGWSAIQRCARGSITVLSNYEASELLKN